MKKITRIFASLVTISALSLVPVAVHAQDVISVDESTTPPPATTTLPATGGSEVKAPETGIAPSNKVAQNSAVFIGGSLLGAGIGLGVVTLRKKLSDQ